jgi:glycosyltransferase involved in cell wall biosynthesis
MAEAFKQMDIWVVGSMTEGLGRMALEAMSAGCAVVLSDTGAEFAEHEKNCLVYPKGDVEAMVKAIDRLAVDDNLRLDIAREGYKTACKYADPEDYNVTLYSILKELQ